MPALEHILCVVILIGRIGDIGSTYLVTPRLRLGVLLCPRRSSPISLLSGSQQGLGILVRYRHRSLWRGHCSPQIDVCLENLPGPALGGDRICTPDQRPERRGWYRRTFPAGQKDSRGFSTRGGKQ